MGGRRLLCKLADYGLKQSTIQPRGLWNSGMGTANLSTNSGSSVLSQRNYRERSAGFHAGRRIGYAVEPTYGVGPQLDGNRDPQRKGDTPDDFRADDVQYMAEPKEITKDAAAKASQEPPDFQVNKAVPESSKPYEEDAEPQRADKAKAFEDKTRKQEGTARYQGETEGTEKSGHEMEGQYGGGPDEGKTTRA